MALPTLNATFASAADVPRRYMLSQWLVGEKEETQGSSSVLVSGAGEGAANGTYTYRGEESGKPYYNLVGEANGIGESSIYWDGAQWTISDNGFYVSSEDTEFLWQATEWTGLNGEEPPPIVTEIPAANPIANYLTLPERYLWAKIAVAAGAPRSEADYISLPKQYAWSDIYNAVSGDIANSSILVSGLAVTNANGLYIRNGEENGKAAYFLNGTNTSNSQSFIVWNGDLWAIEELESGGVYTSDQDVAYPWLVTNWINVGPESDPPTITPQTPNHTDWSEKQALGHIAAAYRGDTANPANLATYIDWPWRYQVASIITSLAAPTTFNAVIVSGAGTSAVNGTYSETGERQGKKYYNLQGSDPFISSVMWNGEFWDIFDENSGVIYNSSEDVEFPWLVETWNIADFGELPTPTLTPTNV